MIVLIFGLFLCFMFQPGRKFNFKSNWQWAISQYIYNMQISHPPAFLYVQPNFSFKAITNMKLKYRMYTHFIWKMHIIEIKISSCIVWLKICSHTAQKYTPRIKSQRDVFSNMVRSMAGALLLGMKQAQLGIHSLVERLAPSHVSDCEFYNGQISL